jgi:hypothetical protein
MDRYPRGGLASVKVQCLRFKVSEIQPLQKVEQLRFSRKREANPSVAKSQPKADPPVAEMPSASKQTSFSGAWMQR